jgi:serine protease Do
VLTAIVAGLVGALVVLLVLPAIFGVNPYDLVRGKVRKTVVDQETNQPKQVTNVVSPTQGATDVSGVAKKVTPSVVNIDVRTTPQTTNPFSLTPQEGTGSGVIYTSDGYIITNNHVVSGAQDITVTLASGTELKGKKVGADPDNDIAVVKVDQANLPAIDIGNSDNLVVGQLVVAVGSPLGFEQTVTAGIVSALHRVVGVTSSTGQSTNMLTDLIQTDATINPGNSGGALCDGSARLVGINALIASQSGGSEGIGFAIPIDTAKMVADDLIAGRPVSHPYVGILGQTVSQSIAQRYNLPVDAGAYVTRVVPGSPADKAGIKAGDIIVGIDVLLRGVEEDGRADPGGEAEHSTAAVARAGPERTGACLKNRSQDSYRKRSTRLWPTGFCPRWTQAISSSTAPTARSTGTGRPTSRSRSRARSARAHAR